jgi:hypothetical protein
MLAMQYSIQLPADYNDALIVQRVQERSKLFDGLGGLRHKAFLYNATDKLYAPFYVWQDMSEARQFLLDQLFRGVTESFKRPRVRNWVVLEKSLGNRTIIPQFAVREIDVIPPNQDIDALCAAEHALHHELLKNENLYCCLSAIDPDRWEIMRYHLWRDASVTPRFSSDCIQTYQVLHVSEPELMHGAA